jgi:hypothetical protein
VVYYVCTLISLFYFLDVTHKLTWLACNLYEVMFAWSKPGEGVQWGTLKLVSISIPSLINNIQVIFIVLSRTNGICHCVIKSCVYSAFKALLHSSLTCTLRKEMLVCSEHTEGTVRETQDNVSTPSLPNIINVFLSI